MNMINDGGPAFPVWEQNGNGQQEMTGFDMTLRDYFAAKAMQGLAANPEAWDMTDEKVAEWAYNAADAMLKARLTAAQQHGQAAPPERARGGGGVGGGDAQLRGRGRPLPAHRRQRAGRDSCMGRRLARQPAAVAPVGVDDGINVPAAKALIKIVGPGFKVIYRDASRWKDASGDVLPHHYEMFSAEMLARRFGYDLVLDLGYAAILRDPSALSQQPAAVDEVMVERIAALLHEEATDEPWTVAGVEHPGPDRAYYRKLARKVLALATQHQEDRND